ncbi:MAG: pentapeptide repeat-containing protein, partial [Bacteroidota bacterium]
VLVIGVFYYSQFITEQSYPFLIGCATGLSVILVIFLILKIVFKISFRKDEISNEPHLNKSNSAIISKIFPNLEKDFVEDIDAKLNRILSIRLNMIYISSIGSMFLVVGGLLGTIVLIRQNKLIESQNINLEKQNNLIESQNEISNLQLVELRNQNYGNSNVLSEMNDDIRTKYEEFIDLGYIRIGGYIDEYDIQELKEIVDKLPRRFAYRSNRTNFERKLSPEKGEFLKFILKEVKDTNALKKIYSEVSFSYSYLNGANFEDKFLSGIDLTGSSLEMVNFTNSNLDSSNLSSTSLRGSMLKNVSLNYTDLTSATLNQSNTLCSDEIYRFHATDEVLYISDLDGLIDFYDDSCLITYLSCSRCTGIKTEGALVNGLQVDGESIKTLSKLFIDAGFLGATRSIKREIVYNTDTMLIKSYFILTDY